ncbi:DUF417 family protein, partial [Methylobacterium isbiliense]
MSTTINNPRPAQAAIAANPVHRYGDQIVRVALYGSLVIIYAWFGGMKFTAYEAEGLVPLV